MPKILTCIGKGFGAKTAAALLLGAAAALSLGARCIENTNVYVDEEGYTHLVGEFYNDTDIQGVSIMLRGTLFDEAGNVIATKDTLICPPDTQPRSQSMFDIRFDNPNVPPHARYEVRAVNGRAMEQALPSPDVVVLRTAAIGFEGIPDLPGLPFSDSDVLFAFDIRNRSGAFLYGMQGCAVAYDNRGKVIAARQDELIQFDEAGNIFPAVLDPEFVNSIFMQLEQVPDGAVSVRAWLWFGNKGDSTSAYQFVMTTPITIQTETFP